MSITRHGMNKTDAGPLKKCTFEQPVDMLVEAAVNGERDETKGVAESVMLGQVADIGTGMMEVLLDEDMLNRAGKDTSESHDDGYYGNGRYDEFIEYDEYGMDAEMASEYFVTTSV